MDEKKKSFLDKLKQRFNEEAGLLKAKSPSFLRTSNERAGALSPEEAHRFKLQSAAQVLREADREYDAKQKKKKFFDF
jgi:hypothetical protein